METTFSREMSAGYMANWAARLFAREIDRRLGPVGLTSGYMPVFFALAGGAALSQKQLTMIAAVEQPTMATTLSRMERDGLIQRTADPSDKRSALIRLTPAALAKARAVREAVSSVNEAALRHLSPGERTQVLALLRKLVKGLEEMSA